MAYRLLCLDAGFTLLSPRRTLRDAFVEVLAAHGRAVDDDELHRAWEAANRWAWEAYHQPGNDTWGRDERIDQLWRAYHSLMLRELGLPGDHDAMLDAILAAQYAVDGWELYPDVTPLLAALAPQREAGELQVAVLSDWGTNLHDLLDTLGVTRRVDFVHASGSVGVGKSDPAFFRMALERAGVLPGESLMVGDSLRADVRGALGAGMHAAWLARSDEQHPDPLAPGELPEGVPVIGSLADVPELVVAGPARAPRA